ncbi:MAG TPA: respiratory nitrate reductase subunit gamma [Desulfomonilaceae bacterium]|nr:respiratory nitrate reductase subunit gamma [Desulfomonilaceae bacterium]
MDSIVLLKFLTYVSGLIFVVAFAAKIVRYFAMPMHVRWELYPVPHEGKAYGGSFYEEIDHWTKARHKNYAAQYLFMLPEIIFVRALYKDNRSLWYWSFPFHMGLYLCVGGLVFLALGALLEAAGLAPSNSSLASLVQALTQVFGVIGYILGTIGALGLIVRRATDPEMKDFTAGIDYMNLIWLAGIFVTGFLVWLRDPGFEAARQYLVSLITFKPASQVMTRPLSALHVINLLLFIGFWAYFPFTHMTHMVSKYFMWDKVKWDDDPNRGDYVMDSKIKKYLGYPVTWSAPHIGAEGGKTWADVATTNPWAAKEKDK